MTITNEQIIKKIVAQPITQEVPKHPRVEGFTVHIRGLQFQVLNCTSDIWGSIGRTLGVRTRNWGCNVEWIINADMVAANSSNGRGWGNGSAFNGQRNDLIRTVAKDRQIQLPFSALRKVGILDDMGGREGYRGYPRPDSLHIIDRHIDEYWTEIDGVKYASTYVTVQHPTEATVTHRDWYYLKYGSDLVKQGTYIYDTVIPDDHPDLVSQIVWGEVIQVENGTMRYAVDAKVVHPLGNKIERHRLAATLLRINRPNPKTGKERWTTYLSGIDENQYFIVELPRHCNTIEDAYEMLKPAAVKRAEAEGIKVLRQGDIFFVPTNVQPDKSTIIHRRHANVVHPMLKWWESTNTTKIANSVALNWLREQYRELTRYGNNTSPIVELLAEIIATGNLTARFYTMRKSLSDADKAELESITDKMYATHGTDETYKLHQKIGAEIAALKAQRATVINIQNSHFASKGFMLGKDRYVQGRINHISNSTNRKEHLTVTLGTEQWWLAVQNTAIISYSAEGYVD